jgi:hypothetical protein
LTEAQQGLDFEEFGFVALAGFQIDFAIAGFQFRLARLKAALAACILQGARRKERPMIRAKYIFSSFITIKALSLKSRNEPLLTAS